MEKVKQFYKKNLVLINNIFGSYAIKGLALLVSFFTLPAYISFFDNNTILGIWFTLLSVVQWILIFDLGLGNGLRNKLVPYLVINDYLSIKKYVSSSYFIIGLICCIAVIIGIPAILMIDWSRVFNISFDIIPSSVLKYSILIVFIGIILQFFLKTILSILYSMKKVALSNFIALMSSVIVLFFVLIGRTGDLSTNLINLSYIKLLSMNVPLIVATLILFKTKLRNSKPELRYVDKTSCLEVIKLGGSFFYIQVALLVINSTNEVIITRLFGPSYVVEYSVYYRLFYLSVTFFSLISNPVWSEVSELYALQDSNKIRSILVKILFLVVIAFAGNLLILLFSQTIFDIWLGSNSIRVNHFYGLVFVIFSSITIFNMSLSIFSNAFNKLVVQVIVYSFGMIVKIPIAIIIARYYPNWISVIMSTTIVLLLYSLIQPRYILKSIKELSYSNKNL